MTTSGWKQLAIALGLLCTALLALCTYLVVSSGIASLRVSFAEDQVAMIDQFRCKALQSGPAGAVDSLDAIVNYYPSGSKQEPATKLDRIVERARAVAVHEIIAHLRAETGEDLDENPETWIHRFRKPNPAE